MKPHLGIVNVEMLPAWGKWPLTDDTDDALLAPGPPTWVDGLEISRIHVNPYAGWIRSGRLVKPRHPYRVDNREDLPEPVMSAMLDTLRDARDALPGVGSAILLWHNAIQCPPTVAAGLRGIFDLCVLNFSDDCPGSTEIKTLPIVHGFDAIIHRMWTWDINTGRTVDSVYEEAGVPIREFTAGGPSTRLLAFLQEEPLPPDRGIDLVFIGFLGGNLGKRKGFLEALAAYDHPLVRRARLHGVGLRDGPLGDYPTSARGFSFVRDVLRVYLRSKLGFNYPISSVFNGRLFDLPLSGVVQLVHDPWHELEIVGWKPHEDYVPFDGTPEGLVERAESLLKDGDLRRRIAESAEKTARRTMEEFGFPRALARVIRRGLDLSW